jgi:hypothetical protein
MELLQVGRRSLHHPLGVQHLDVLLRVPALQQRPTQLIRGLGRAKRDDDIAPRIEDAELLGR